VGTHLHRWLFSGPVKTRFDQEYGKVKDDPDCGLRIRLTINPPMLAALPWELLYNPELKRFLATWEKTLLTRQIPVSVSATNMELTVLKPLRVLVAIPNYTGLSQDTEEEVVREAFEKLTRKGFVELHFLKDKVTTASLMDELKERRYHIFHFIGHGCFDLDKNAGYLQLNRDEDDRDDEASFDPTLTSSQTLKFLRSDIFADIFQNHPTMKLIVLNSCQGGQISTTRPLTGFAPDLCSRDIPAIVAMQYPIFDDTSVIFAKNLYGKLCKGYARGIIDVAVTHARNSIHVKRRGDVDFATPVLFMNSSTGLIFDLGDEDTPPEHELSSIETGETRVINELHSVGLGSARRLLRGITSPLRKAGDLPRLKAVKEARKENLSALKEDLRKQDSAAEAEKVEYKILHERKKLSQVEGRIRAAVRASRRLTGATLALSLFLFAASIYGLLNVFGLDDRLENISTAVARNPAAGPFGDDQLRTVLVAEQTKVEGFPSENRRDDRHYHAKLIDALAAAGAKVVAFDIHFVKDEEHGYDTEWDHELAEAVWRAAANGTEVIFGVDGVNEDGEPKEPLPGELREVLRDRWGDIQTGEEWAGFRPAYRSVVLADRITEGPKREDARGVGVAVAPSFILQALRRFKAATPSRPPEPVFFPEQKLVRLLDAGGQSALDIPVINEDASFQIDFPSEEALRGVRHTYQEVYGRREDLNYLRNNFAGKLVLVGYTDNDTHYVTGVRRIAGTEIQAAAISNIIRGEYLQNLPGVWNLLVIVFMVLVGLLLNTKAGQHLGLRLQLEHDVMRKNLLVPVTLLAVTCLYLVALYFVYHRTPYVLTITYHLAALFISYWLGRLIRETHSMREEAKQVEG
jgi:CHASE2 domain-containing sensor protein